MTSNFSFLTNLQFSVSISNSNWSLLSSVIALQTSRYTFNYAYRVIHAKKYGARTRRDGDACFALWNWRKWNCFSQKTKNIHHSECFFILHSFIILLLCIPIWYIHHLYVHRLLASSKFLFFSVGKMKFTNFSNYLPISFSLFH